MNHKIKTVSACRLCDSADIFEILNFGEVPLANNLREAADLDSPEFAAPLRVFECKNCGSHQLFDTVNPEILFKNYNYFSPPNLQKHFSGYAAETAFKLFQIPDLNPKQNFLIVGIGGNNGILEKEYQKIGFKKVVNVEPAKNIAEISQNNGIETVNEFFTPTAALQIRKEKNLAKLITCNNCFAHIENLNEIVESIKILLAKDGMFVFENAYWLNTIFNLDAGQIYSEHLFYHSIKPLQIFFKKHNLELFDVTLNEVQMGSFRCFVGWPGIHEISSSVQNLIKLENNFGLYRASTYEKFKRDVEFEGIKVRNSLKKFGKVALYGVPAKIVLLIKIWELEKFISYAVDDSPIKIQKIIPGTKIEIKSSEFWRSNNPAATLAGSYNFASDIQKKNPQYQNSWIVPFTKK